MSDSSQKRAAELAQITDRQWQHMVSEGVLLPTAETAGFTRGKTKLYSATEIGVAKALAPFIRMNLSPEMMRKAAEKIRPLWDRIAAPGAPGKRLLKIAMYRDEPFVALSDIVEFGDDLTTPSGVAVEETDEPFFASFAAFDVVMIFDVFNICVVHGPFGAGQADEFHQHVDDIRHERSLLDQMIERENETACGFHDLSRRSPDKGDAD